MSLSHLEKRLCPELSPVAFFIPALNGGGAQKVIVNLANALVDLTARPIHIVLVRKEGPFLQDLRAEVEIIELGIGRTAFAIPSLVRYLRKARPAVLMSSMHYVNVIAVLAHRLAGCPGRLVLREATILPSVTLRSSLKVSVIRTLMRLTYKFSCAVVANSTDTLQSLKEAGIKLPRNNLVIWNPVSISTTATSGTYAGPKGVSYICAVGRLVPLKGFSLLLRALAQCESKELHLVILGEGPLYPTLLRQARELGVQERVHLPGFVNPPTLVMRHSEAVVLSSHWEGFGNVLVEALAAGAPVIATDCAGAPREILCYGKYGRLVPVNDVYALARAIDEVLVAPISNPEERKSRAEQFDPSYIATRYLESALLPIDCDNGG